MGRRQNKQGAGASLAAREDEWEQKGRRVR